MAFTNSGRRHEINAPSSDSAPRSNRQGFGTRPSYNSFNEVRVVADVKPRPLPTTKGIMNFKGNQYSIDVLLKQTGPDIVINYNDLHADDSVLVTYGHEIDPSIHTGRVVFAKYEGKYVVLLGSLNADEQKAKDAQIKGKLLANPVLKNAVIV